MMNRITPVVKQLLIINVIFYVFAVYITPNIYDYLPLHYFTDDGFQPFQFVSSMFMHSNRGISHILFNMMSLFFLGPMVEQRMGAKHFLIFYIICGFAANLAHWAMIYFGVIPSVRVVGASGAIMGVFAAFAYYFPNVKLMLLFPPIPVKAKYMMIGLIAFDLFSGISGFSTGIAHFAHLGGVLSGLLLIIFWNRNEGNKYRIN